MTSAELLLWWAEDPARERDRRAALVEALEGATPTPGWANRARVRALGGAAPADGPAPARGAVVAESPADAATQVRDGTGRAAPVCGGSPRPTAWLLPGHGAEHPGMATALHGTCAAFTAACDSLLDDLGPAGHRARAWWLAGSEQATDTLEGVQPMLMALEWGLAALLRSWGVAPAALLGHSVGETMAGRVAGVFGRVDFARLATGRLAHLGLAAPGGMVAVAGGTREVLEVLVRVRARERGVVIGAVNGPRQILVCGPAEPLAGVVGELRATGLVCAETGARQGFHSPAVREACAAGGPLFATLDLRSPGIPIHSGYTGRLLDEDTTRSPGFWCDQPARPVRFHAALDSLLAGGPHLLVEVGPGQTLSGVARRHRAVMRGSSRSVAMLPAGPAGSEVVRRHLLETAAVLWREGAAHDVDGLENTLNNVRHVRTLIA